MSDTDKERAIAEIIDRLRWNEHDPHVRRLAKEAYDAGRKAGIEDAAKMAYEDGQALLAAQIRKLGEKP